MTQPSIVLGSRRFVATTRLDCTSPAHGAPSARADTTDGRERRRDATTQGQARQGREGKALLRVNSPVGGLRRCARVCLARAARPAAARGGQSQPRATMARPTTESHRQGRQARPEQGIPQRGTHRNRAVPCASAGGGAPAGGVCLRASSPVMAPVRLARASVVFRSSRSQHRAMQRSSAGQGRGPSPETRRRARCAHRVARSSCAMPLCCALPHWGAHGMPSGFSHWLTPVMELK